MLSPLCTVFTNIPETIRVYIVHSAAAVVYLQFMLHVMLFRPWNMFCISTLALPAVCVLCPIWLVCVIPRFRAFPVCCSDIEWLWDGSTRPVITYTTFAFIFHVCWISIISYSYIKTFSASFLITILSPVIATSIDMHVPCLLSGNMMSGLLLATVLSVCTVRSTIL